MFDVLASQKRSRQVHTLDSARTVGVLFDATSETARRESLEFVHSLEKQGKKVSALGFFNLKQAPENQAFAAATSAFCAPLIFASILTSRSLAQSPPPITLPALTEECLDGIMNHPSWPQLWWAINRARW